MNIYEYTIGAAILFFSIFLIVVIMLQASNSRGLAALDGGTNDSFYSKNKGRTHDAKLARMTKISAGMLMLLVVLANFISNFKPE